MANAAGIPQRFQTEPLFSGRAASADHIKDPLAFLTRMEPNQLAINDDAVFIARITGNLREGAADWWFQARNLAIKGDDTDWDRAGRDYDYFKKIFLKRYKPESREGMLILEFSDIKQGPNELLLDYYLRLTHIVSEQMKRQASEASASMGTTRASMATFLRTEDDAVPADLRDLRTQIVNAYRDNPQGDARPTIRLDQETAGHFLALIGHVRSSFDTDLIQRITFNHVSAQMARGLKHDGSRKKANQLRFTVDRALPKLYSLLEQYELHKGYTSVVLNSSDRTHSLKGNGYAVAAVTGEAIYSSSDSEGDDPAEVAAAKLRKKKEKKKKQQKARAAAVEQAAAFQRRGPPGASRSSAPPQRLPPSEVGPNGCVWCQRNTHSTAECRSMARAREGGSPGGARPRRPPGQSYEQQSASALEACFLSGN